VAVASAGQYASLHLAPDSKPCQHPTTQIFTGQTPFLLPNQQSQSTEGKQNKHRTNSIELTYNTLLHGNQWQNTAVKEF